MHNFLQRFPAVRMLFTSDTDEAAAFSQEYGGWDRVEVNIEETTTWDSDRGSTGSDSTEDGDDAPDP